MKRFLIICFLLFLVVAALAAGSAVALYMWAAKDLPDIKHLQDYKPPLVTTVYTRNGEILGYFAREKRFLVTLEDMPAHLPKAFLAAEDAAFYEHEGVDLAAIFRAFIVNLRSGSTRQGGSTITQQVVKRLLLSSEKKYKRKLKEAILAYKLERFLSKDEILTMYLNQIFFGARAYGVEAAARAYFAKHVGELTLAESAVLAGLPQAPSRYDPYKYPEKAKLRQKYVLEQMLKQNWITQAEYDEALAQPLVYQEMEEITWKEGAYYLEEVRRWLIDYLSEENMKAMGIELDRYGEDAVLESGLHVYTAADLDHIRAAEKAMKEGLEANTKRRGWRGPVEQVAKEDFESWLAKQEIEPEEVAPDKWFQVLVTEVTKSGAKIRFGKYEGSIAWADMQWTRKGSPSGAVKVGDVVWAKVKAPELPEGEKAKPEVEANATGVEEPEDLPNPIDALNQIVDMSLEQKPLIQGALVSMEPPTGEVVAIVGGYDFHESQFCRATQAYRQTGSAFKPIVYSTALDNGLTVASTILDAPFVFEDPYTHKLWKPSNYGHDFSGPMLFRTALVKSKNLVTVRIAQMVGVEKIIERAKALGLEPEFPPTLAISLGAVAVTPYNLMEAYTAFARGGSTIEPRMVLSVKEAWGREIYNAKPKIKEVLSPQNAFIMCYLLKEVVNSGTGYKARQLGRPVGGKTGTTNNEQDAWFMGFSPYLLTGVWVGFDEVQSMGRGETGGTTALPIWLAYRQAVEENYPVQDFPVPPGVVFESFGGFSLPFIAGTQPSVSPQGGWYWDTGDSGDGGGDGDGGEPSGEDLFKQIF